MATQAVSTAWRRAGASPAVLVVDDDQALAEMVGETLEADGFAAAWCGSPAQALELAAPGRFEAAVVDLQMPGMDGLALIDRLRSRDPDLQCLVLTGHASFDSARLGLRQGVFDYLCKADLPGGALALRVRQAVERVRLERERRELVVRLGILAATSAAIAAEPHLDPLLKQLVASSRGLCRAASARVVLLAGPPCGPWAVTGAAGDGAHRLAGSCLRPREGLAALAAETRTVQLDPDYHPDPGDPNPWVRFDTAWPGLIAAPIEHRGVLGLVMAAGARRAPFGHGERDALAALARQGAVAIDNARQHAQAARIQTRVVRLADEVQARLAREERPIEPGLVAEWLQTLRTLGGQRPSEEEEA